MAGKRTVIGSKFRFQAGEEYCDVKIRGLIKGTAYYEGVLIKTNSSALKMSVGKVMRISHLDIHNKAIRL